MKRGVLVTACCVLALLAACNKKEAPTPPPPETFVSGDVDYDRDNLLNLARGASVVSRTAELGLENSAAHAIDGDWLTFWKSAPNGPEQTLAFALPTRSRIDHLGAILSSNPHEIPLQIRFDASDDAAAWREVATLVPKLQNGPQLISVKPFDAAYVRVRTEGATGYYSVLYSVIAKGSELAPRVQPSVDGCWTINGMPSRFVQHGSRVSGVIGGDSPMYVSGATDGRVVRLMWTRGPMWGWALLALDPRRRELTGVRWHERVGGLTAGDGWFGTPCVGPPTSAAAAGVGGATLDETQIAATVLQRAGQWVAYSDDSLGILTALIARLPSRQFRVTAPARSRAATLPRVEFEVVQPKTITEPQRVLADGVALHLR